MYNKLISCFSHYDYSLVRTILAQVKKSVTCEIGLAGSIAQRLLLSIIGGSLRDADLLLLGGSFENRPVLPSIKDDFYVTHIDRMNHGYYFANPERRFRLLLLGGITGGTEEEKIRDAFDQAEKKSEPWERIYIVYGSRRLNAPSNQRHLSVNRLSADLKSTAGRFF